MKLEFLSFRKYFSLLWTVAVPRVMPKPAVDGEEAQPAPRPKLDDDEDEDIEELVGA